MLRFATVGLTASKMIKFQCERSSALFVLARPSRRYMSNDDARQKKLTELTKSTIAKAGVTEGNKMANSINVTYITFILKTKIM